MNSKYNYIRYALRIMVICLFIIGGYVDYLRGLRSAMEAVGWIVLGSSFFFLALWAAGRASANR